MFAMPGPMAYYPWGSQPDIMDFDGFGLLSGRGRSNRRDIPDVFFPRAVSGCSMDAYKATERQHCSGQASAPIREHGSSRIRTQHPGSSHSYRHAGGAAAHHGHRQQQQSGRSAATASAAPTPPAEHTSQSSGAAPAQHAMPRAQQQHEQQQQQRPMHDNVQSTGAATTTPCPPVQNRHSCSSSISPNAAATTVQTAWRMHRLRKEYPVLKQLAAAAAQLATVVQQLQEQQQSGVAMTQKQYLQLSEPVMKVLFSIDDTSSSAAELRTVRKRLSAQANQLLDRLESIYKSGSTAAAAAAPPAPPAPPAADTPTSHEAEMFHDCEEDPRASLGDDSVYTDVNMQDVAPVRDQPSRQRIIGTAHTQTASCESPVSPPVAVAACGSSNSDVKTPAAPRAHRHRRRRPRQQQQQQQQQQEQLLRAGLCPSRWWLRHVAT